MQIEFHCFGSGAKIDPTAISFPFKDMLLSVSNDKRDNDEILMLKLSKKISPEELSVEGEIRDEQGQFIEKRMRPYKELLTEGANLIEGLFSIFYLATPPKFDTDKILVNVITENVEEEELIKSGKITGGFGNIFQQLRKPLYQVNDKVTNAGNEATEHLPALSFLAQAIRSQEQNDHEVAFFLYFRIIDGYFSDGVSDVESALLKNTTELSKYIDYVDETKNATKSILSELKLSSKSETNFEGLVSDIVLIRHKFTHFSKTNATRHHQTSTKFELNVLNFYLKKACVRILLDQISLKN